MGAGEMHHEPCATTPSCDQLLWWCLSSLLPDSCPDHPPQQPSVHGSPLVVVGAPQPSCRSALAAVGCADCHETATCTGNPAAPPQPCAQSGSSPAYSPSYRSGVPPQDTMRREGIFFSSSTPALPVRKKRRRKMLIKSSDAPLLAHCTLIVGGVLSPLQHL